MGSTFYTELRRGAYVVQVQRDAFHEVARNVRDVERAPKLWSFELVHLSIATSIQG